MLWTWKEPWICLGSKWDLLEPGGIGGSDTHL